MTVLAMSHDDLSRYDTVLRFDRGQLRAEDAALLLGVGRSQIYRLLDRLRADGPEGHISWTRVRPSAPRLGLLFGAKPDGQHMVIGKFSGLFSLTRRRHQYVAPRRSTFATLGMVIPHSNWIQL